MIKQENIIINDNEYIRTYSDRGFMIHGGVPEADYSEALDPAELGRTYAETDIPIDGDIDAEKILDILLGGNSE